MKKLADAIVAGALSVAYGLVFISLIARALDHGGWWILAGALALLTNHALMRYQFARSKAIEGDAGFDDLEVRWGIRRPARNWPSRITV